MTRFVGTLMLRPGRHHIKFLVDGEWRLAPTWPMEQDEMGNDCNVVEIKATDLTLKPVRGGPGCYCYLKPVLACPMHPAAPARLACAPMRSDTRAACGRDLAGDRVPWPSL